MKLSSLLGSLSVAALLASSPVLASQQSVNIGSAPNDATGDKLRNAFSKINQNFNEIYGCQEVTVGTGLSKSGCTITFTKPVTVRDGALTPGSYPMVNATGDGLIDSGMLAVSTVAHPYPPTANDDVNQGFIASSTWMDTVAGKRWDMVSNAPGAAVWVTNSTGIIYHFDRPSWTWNQTTAISTASPLWSVPGSPNATSIQSGRVLFADVQPTKLYFRAAGSPGNFGGTTFYYKATLYYGTAAVMASASNVTCTISDSANDCSVDLTAGSPTSIPATTNGKPTFFSVKVEANCTTALNNNVACPAPGYMALAVELRSTN